MLPYVRVYFQVTNILSQSLEKNRRIKFESFEKQSKMNVNGWQHITFFLKIKYFWFKLISFI